MTNPSATYIPGYAQQAAPKSELEYKFLAPGHAGDSYANDVTRPRAEPEFTGNHVSGIYRHV